MSQKFDETIYPDMIRSLDDQAIDEDVTELLDRVADLSLRATETLVAEMRLNPENPTRPKKRTTTKALGAGLDGELVAILAGEAAGGFGFGL